MHINPIILLGRNSPRSRPDRAASRAIDGLAILRQPVSHLLEARDEFRLNCSVGLWPDIQQEIRIRPGGIDKILNKLPGALEVLVILVVPPRAIHRLASLEWQR